MLFHILSFPDQYKCVNLLIHTTNSPGNREGGSRGGEGGGRGRGRGDYRGGDYRGGGHRGRGGPPRGRGNQYFALNADLFVADEFGILNYDASWGGQHFFVFCLGQEQFFGEKKTKQKTLTP